MKNGSKVFLISFIIIGATSLGLFANLLLPPIFDTLGPIPRFVQHDWMELDKISSIGKFRSTLGHGYPDDDDPTSKKHYFDPSFQWGNSSTSIYAYSPVKTRVLAVFWERHRLEDGSVQGKQVHLQSIDHPSIIFKLFHLNVEPFDIFIGKQLDSGDIVGYLDVREGSNTDIAVTRNGKEISWFEVISDSLLQKYQRRGIKSRDMMIKTSAEATESKDMGYNFSNPDPADWITLKNTSYSPMVKNPVMNASHIQKISYLPNNLYDLKKFYATWFQLKNSLSNTSIKSPINGTISTVDDDNNEVKITYTSTNYELAIHFYNITNIDHLTEGEPINSGSEIGDGGKNFAIRCIPSISNPPSIFELMDRSTWGRWSSKGLNYRSSNLLTHTEYSEILDTNAWWITLN